jgi:hypothetical protein
LPRGHTGAAEHAQRLAFVLLACPGGTIISSISGFALLARRPSVETRIANQVRVVNILAAMRSRALIRSIKNAAHAISRVFFG